MGTYVQDVKIVEGAVTVSASDIEIGAVELKNGATDDRALISAANTARAVGNMTLLVQVVDAAAGIVSTTATEASVGIMDDWDESDRAKVNPIVGQAGVAAGAGAVGATVQRMTLASDDSAVTALQIMDDWDESDRAKVNPIVGQAGVAAGAGAVGATVQRMTLASDDPAVASLSVLDDWDNAASDGASVSGDTAHDSADAGEPVKVGHKAISLGADPTEVAANDRTNWYANRAGVPFTIGGHPNILTKQLNITDGDGAQTDTNLLAAVVAATDRCVVTLISVTADGANSGDVGVRIGFGAANTPANDAAGVILSHPGIKAGSGVVIGNGAGIVGIGGDGEELRITCEDPAGGALDVVVHYFIIDNS